ncbi:MAG: ribonuclease HII [Alphaproteobacteria bacterium]
MPVALAAAGGYRELMATRRKSSDRPVISADYSAEAACHGRGRALVAGVDEAGRGPLAGPVVAAAVILDRQAIPAGLADSKVLGESTRQRLYGVICTSAIVAVGVACARTIDAINIRQATLLAMRRAIAGLAANADAILIDGRDIPDGLPSAIEASALIGGDGRSLSIAAASIVAKVTRDRLMERCGVIYPEYGFERHKGYGTVAHMRALKDYGPTPLHRKSFAPVAAAARHRA